MAMLDTAHQAFVLSPVLLPVVRKMTMAGLEMFLLPGRIAEAIIASLAVCSCLNGGVITGDAVARTRYVNQVPPSLFSHVQSLRYKA